MYKPEATRDVYGSTGWLLVSQLPSNSTFILVPATQPQVSRLHLKRLQRRRANDIFLLSPRGKTNTCQNMPTRNHLINHWFTLQVTMYWLRWHYHVKDIAGAP